MARDTVPDSVQDSRSLHANSGKSYLYGGTAAIVGILALLVGGAFLLLGNTFSGGVLAGLGAVLFVAGFLVARYGK